MVDFILDDDRVWIARLSCGHRQHVRHNPPLQERAWVLDETTRRERLGTCLLCPSCDRAELPEGLRFVRKSPMWDRDTAPTATRSFHHLADGTWGVLTVEVGQVRFVTHGEVVMNQLVDQSCLQAIPPGLDHLVKFVGPVRFSIDYLSVERGCSASLLDELTNVTSDEGGESACYGNLVCADCGAILDSDSHVTPSQSSARPIVRPTRAPLIEELRTSQTSSRSRIWRRSICRCCAFV